MTQPQPQNEPITVDSASFEFKAIDLGSSLYGTIKGMKIVMLNKNMLTWFNGDSEFIGTLIHEVAEQYIIVSIANILEELQIMNVGKYNFPIPLPFNINQDLRLYQNLFDCIRNISHFMTSESLNEYLYLTDNKPFSKYIPSESNKKV